MNFLQLLHFSLRDSLTKQSGGMPSLSKAAAEAEAEAEAAAST